jgi:hypothetical protein
MVTLTDSAIKAVNRIQCEVENTCHGRGEQPLKRVVGA